MTSKRPNEQFEKFLLDLVTIVDPKVLNVKVELGLNVYFAKSLAENKDQLSIFISNLRILAYSGSINANRMFLRVLESLAQVESLQRFLFTFGSQGGQDLLLRMLHCLQSPDRQTSVIASRFVDRLLENFEGKIFPPPPDLCNIPCLFYSILFIC